jgi:chemotaxis protein methyltransferase CheR
VEIWTAACSTGEEAYTILFTMLEALGPQAEVNVLASDISTRALGVAQRATYRAESVQSLPSGWMQKFFLRGNGKWSGWLRVKPEYRRRVRVRRWNLVNDELPPERFPAIFCRNVMIYFDKPTQNAVIRRLTTNLEPGGALFVGHSESLAGTETGLQYVMPAVYCLSGRAGPWLNSRG